MLNFDYKITTKIIFGKKRLNCLAKEILKYSKNILLVTGRGSIKKISLYNDLIEILKNNDIKFYELSGIDPNPRLTSVKEGIEICRKNNIEFILAAGGGSVIDCAKAIAAGFYYKGDVWDYCLRKVKIQRALPIGTILTLTATGSEMNGNSVISNMQTNQKFSMKSDLIKPKFSILNPEYTYSVNAYQTAAGTVDIMSHIFEQYFSPSRGVFLQDRLAEALLKTCIHYAPLAIKEPNNYEARANLMWTGSLALNELLTYGKITDWSTHAMEHELSAFHDITHGAGLAILTPYWMEYVLSKDTVAKFKEYGKNIWDIKDSDPMIVAKKAIQKTRTFFNSLNMPSTLKEVGIDKNNFDKMAQSACRFGDIGGLKKLNQDDVKNILLKAYE